MNDLAPLKLASSIACDWASAVIPARQCTDLAILHVKAAPQHVAALDAVPELPGMGRVAVLDAVECLRIGPGEWLLIAPIDQRERLAAVGQRFAVHGAASVMSEDRLVVMELAASAALLSSLTGLPEAAMAPGHVARTRLADLPAVISAGVGGRFRLLFDRGFALHLRAWLDRAI